MAVEAKDLPKSDDPPLKKRRRPHRFRMTVDQVLAAGRKHHGLYAPAALELGCSRSDLKRFLGTHTRAAHGWMEATQTLVDRVEGGLFKKAVVDEDFNSMKLVLSAKAPDRGYGGTGAASADGGAGGPGIGKLTLMSVPSSFFLMKVNDKDRLLNPAQTEALRSGVTDDAELASLGHDEPPVGMLPDEDDQP